MSARQAIFEDQNVMDFHDLHASPAKSEASSVDIYDDLDMSMTIPEETTTKQPSPSKDCLDLYEEIITEEGTAKEASFNNLSTEYEKCQKQMKQLINKLKEIQCQNTNLQNENQCLKKNISALIKTARVEITRKEEEINKLNQRLCVPGLPRSFKLDPVPSQCINPKVMAKELPKDTQNKPSNLMKEVKPLETSSKDIISKYASPRNTHEQAKSCVEINSNLKTEQKNSKENDRTEKHKVVDGKSKKEIDSDNQSREVERRQKGEGHRSKISTVTDNGSIEVKVKSQLQPTKTGKSERSQESRSVKKTDIDCKTANRKLSSSSYDRPSSAKENLRNQEQQNSKEKHLKTHEKTEHRKDSKGHEHDKVVEHRHRTSEKDDGSQKSKRTHSSSLKNENRKSSLSEQNADKRSVDSDKRAKRYSEYDSKYLSKDSKSSKDEARPSGSKNKTNYNSKSSSKQDSRMEKKRSKDEGNESDQNRRGNRKEDKVSHQSSNKVKIPECPTITEMSSQALNSQREGCVENLKLSFMETLNLTLSPAKKKSQDLDAADSTVSSKETDRSTEATSKECLSTKHGKDSQENLDKPENSLTMALEDAVCCEDITLVHQPEHVEDSVAIHKEQATMIVKEDEALAEPSQANDDCMEIVHIEPESIEDFDPQSILNEPDLIVLDSYIEIDKCSGNESSSGNLNMSVPAENVQVDEVILANISEDVDQTSSLKPNVTGATTGICESSNSDQCLHDDNSVMSLDLNFLRVFPKVVSPLKSPARPLALLPTTERTAKASVVSVSYKDLPPDVNRKIPNEPNKENCEPVRKTDLDPDATPIEISSDEVEEGEIVSDEELDDGQPLQSKSSPSQSDSIKDTSVSKSPVSQEIKVTSLMKPNGAISPLRQSALETKKKPKLCAKVKLIALPVDKKKGLNADSCLEGVLKIVPPSNIQDVLQMLRIIRKHIRKKYMKFKIQFPLTQFHRFVEAVSLYFTTLTNRLDWSRLCSSQERLQNKMCKVIESRFKQLKKNGIVDRIFEQRLIDMKKRLWKFVEEQLDSLFDILKGMIIKLCDKAKSDHDQDEKQIVTSLSTKALKSDRIKSSPKACKRFKAKASVAKSEKDSCLRSLDLPGQRDDAHSRPQTAEGPTAEKTLLKDWNTISDKKVISPRHNMRSSSKPDLANECWKDQHKSAGLSFNLVSDDHMGDIFKSLLNDSDNLELNTMEEHTWILDSPEKTSTLIQKPDTVSSLTEIKTPEKATFPWPSISPPHVNSLPTLETVLTPDVYDENCLLEIPMSTPSSKSTAASEDRHKSYSVLMEDLAVSLTVPSPLKSDSHLSFLRPVCDPEPMCQISAHYSEDAVLDEEDAIEQDIHLTLDSDNSSTGSPENSTEPDRFQCHPSEPMQAVIMEKSNDHFIVKIRRAVSSTSPVSESSSVGESDNAATGLLESTHCNALDVSLQQEIHSETKLGAESKTGSLSESRETFSEFSFSKLDEKSEHFTDLKHRTCSSPKTVQAVISILPDLLNQSVIIPSEVQLPNTGKVQSHCEKSIPVCPEKNTEECDQVKATIAEEPLMDSDLIKTTLTEEIINRQSQCADTMIEGRIPEPIDSNQKKKKRKSSDEEPPSKRRNVSFLHDIKDKKENSRNSKPEAEDKPQRKHRRIASEGNVNLTSFKLSPSGGISAKNVIKKKGEVVVSWTRNEDREILLECQQNGPNRKTFLALASKMSKYPHQVEERFRQLMKLFKKSRNSIS